MQCVDGRAAKGWNPVAAGHDTWRMAPLAFKATNAYFHLHSKLMCGLMAPLRQGPWGFLVTLLFALLWHRAAGMLVGTAEEFMAALARAAGPTAPNSTLIELRQNISLTANSTVGFGPLPIQLTAPKTVTIQGGQSKGHSRTRRCRLSVAVGAAFDHSPLTCDSPLRMQRTAPCGTWTGAKATSYSISGLERHSSCDT
jgi:hypothetical protein